MCSVLYLSSPTQIELFLIHIFLECILKKKDHRLQKDDKQFNCFEHR